MTVKREMGSSRQPVRIRQILRPMRGTSGSLLVRGDDNFLYVAKCQVIPERSRLLANEIIAHSLLKILGISTPDVEILLASHTLITEPPQRDVLSVTEGLYFGSRLPLHESATLWDFLPHTLSSRISNLLDFGLIWLFDLWVGNRAMRQAVFGRQSEDRLFRAWFIDNKHCFGGVDWLLNSEIKTPPTAWYHPEFDLNTAKSIFLGRIRHCSRDDISEACSRVPEAWAAGDRQVLDEQIIDPLIQRIPKLNDFLLGSSGY